MKFRMNDIFVARGSISGLFPRFVKIIPSPIITV